MRYIIIIFFLKCSLNAVAQMAAPAASSQFRVGDGINIPKNTLPPSSSGSFIVGQTISVNTGTWSNSPTSYAYQVQRNGQDIVGETANSYSLSQADVSQAIRWRVVATNAIGFSIAYSSTVSPAPLGGNLQTRTSSNLVTRTGVQIITR